VRFSSHLTHNTKGDNTAKKTRKGDNPRFSGYREKTLRKNKKAWGSGLTLGFAFFIFASFRSSKTTKVSHISERYSQQNLLRSITPRIRRQGIS
jgi:hypothetical protein